MHTICFLAVMVGIVSGYPFGAPPGICTLDHPAPNHESNKAQQSPMPFDLSMSKDQVTSLEDKITVTIKSKPGGAKFKGFLVLPKDESGVNVGTWDNDAVSHPIDSCSATTHDNRNPKDFVQLVWRPVGHVPKGRIIMKAIVVQQFDTFWVDIPIPVAGSSGTPEKLPSPQTPTTVKSILDLTTTTKAPPAGGVPLPGLKPISLPELTTTKEVPTTTKETSTTSKVTPTTTTPTTTTTKKRSFINRLFGGGKDKETTTTTTKATTTTTKPTTTTTKPTTTTIPSTTTKKKSLISRIFGGGGDKATTTKGTTTTTTTTAATTTEVQTTTTATTTTTTTKGSLIKRLLG